MSEDYNVITINGKHFVVTQEIKEQILSIVTQNFINIFTPGNSD